MPETPTPNPSEQPTPQSDSAPTKPTTAPREDTSPEAAEKLSGSADPSVSDETVPTAPVDAASEKLTVAADSMGSAQGSPGNAATSAGTKSTGMRTGAADAGPLMAMRQVRQLPPPRWRTVSFPPGLFAAVAVSGIAAAALVPLERPGIGWLLAGLVIAAAVVITDRRARRAAEPAEGSRLAGGWWRVWWVGIALALLGVGAVRAAGWLFVLCVLGACVAGSVAAVGRRSAVGVWFDVIAVPVAGLAGLPWVYYGLGRLRGGVATTGRRVWVSVGVTVALLAVFAPLLGGADATFARLLDAVTPNVDVPSIVQWIFLFVVAGLGVIGALYLLAGPPVPATGTSRPTTGHGLRRVEWALPVGALTVLFAVFVGVQFVALFGGDDYVQRTAGLTYAEYARTGFWQLSIVTMLTLGVIAVVLRWAAADSTADRTWLRVLVCAVSLLSLIIAASALGRMWTYQQAYGFTILRVLVEVCELWIGLVYLLVIASVLRLDWSRVPRAAVGTALATLLALAILNPEGLVADRNIDRWQQGKNLDTDYLSTLSPDILPAINRLPAHLRTEIRTPIHADLPNETWQSWNWSRANAR